MIHCLGDYCMHGVAILYRGTHDRRFFNNAWFKLTPPISKYRILIWVR